MGYQVHDPNTHSEDEWDDIAGTFRSAEEAARAYLGDLDPADDCGDKWHFLVRGEDGEEHRFDVGIEPISWTINGRRLSR